MNPPYLCTCTGNRAWPLSQQHTDTVILNIHSCFWNFRRCFFTSGNLLGNSHVIINGNEGCQWNTRGKRAHRCKDLRCASEHWKSQETCLLRWLEPQTCFISSTDEKFCLSAATEKTSKLSLQDGPLWGQPSPRLLAGRVLKCTGKTEVLPLALQSPEDTPPLCRKDPKVISKTPQGKMFVCVHVQVQGVHIMLKSIPWTYVREAECKSLTEECDRMYCLLLVWQDILLAFYLRALQCV